MKTKKSNTRKSSAIALSIAYILWGINTPVIKLGLQTIPTTTFMTIKMLGACLLILPFAIKTWKPINRRTFLILVFSALIWISVGNFVFYEGLKRAPSLNAATIALLGPLVLFFLSIQFLHEKFKLRIFIGVVLAFVGSFIIIGQPLIGTINSSVIVGNLLFLSAVCCHVIATIMVKPQLKKVSTYQATFIHLFFGVMPIAIYEIINIGSLRLDSFNAGSYFALAYGVFAVTLANFLLVFGLKRRKTTEIGVFYYVEPITTIAVAILVFGEVIKLNFVLGAILVFLGIYLVEVRVSDKVRVCYGQTRC